MTTPRTAAHLVLALAFLLIAAPAWAHMLGISAGAYTARGSSVLGALTFARGDLAALVPALDANHDGHLSALEVREGRPLLRAQVLDHVLVTSGPDTCAPTLVDAGLTEEDGLVVRGRWDCPPGDAPFVIDLALLDVLAPGHRHIVGAEVLSGDERRLTLPRAAEPVAPAVDRPAATPGAGTFFGIGMQHILSGLDHLVFLLGLVLVVQATGRSIRSILAVVTAFTVGHSISLAVSLLGLWTPSPRLIEPAIALSIVYVGVENFFVPSLRGRWRITFPFGLVHGFGLAGALQAIALPKAAVPMALVSFNLGVEAGQLAVLAVLLPVLLAVRRRSEASFVRYGVPVLSGAVAIAGGIWLVVRLVG